MHIDEVAIATVSKIFRDYIPVNSVVLDLMSSWRSHWPEGHSKRRLIGLGLNAVEMQDNPDLNDYVVHDVNRNPALPFDDDTFDAAVITVSAQYLIKPVETFAHVNRVLKPGGNFIVTFSNRMFPHQGGPYLEGLQRPGPHGGSRLLHGPGRELRGDSRRFCKPG